ncbi:MULTISPECIES: hypothetical protein [Nostocales]|uniref:Uncharacterized protein n=3 Tax=Nostocales TaxID=1161 RepID=A0A0C1R5B6_9CYAN|nr:hypothetical protein [Tolypothrix bouteillei]
MTSILPLFGETALVQKRRTTLVRGVTAVVRQRDLGDLPHERSPCVVSLATASCVAEGAKAYNTSFLSVTHGCLIFAPRVLAITAFI